jgi:hypothetical protein
MKRIASTLVVIGILNFASFFIIALSLGGDAVNGKREVGKYYLCEHGHYTEVSQAVFKYSKLHVYSVWITHPLALLGGFFLNRERKRQQTKPAAPLRS